MIVTKNYTGALSSKLAEYRTKGQKEASKHRPPTDATGMDNNETSLLSEADKWLVDEQRLFDFSLTEASRADVEAQQKAVELQAKVDQLVSDTSLLSTIEADMSADRQALVAATEARMKTEVDYNYFRAVNGITEQARYPESHVMHFAVVLGLALLETIINAFFYENAQGLMGGFTVALGVAVVNMGGAMLLGVGFRNKNLAALEMKILGWLCLVLFLVFSIYCNALFAAFRSEYQLLVDPSEPLQLREAFTLAAGEAKRIFVFDMQVADLTSFILLGLGVLLSLLAFYKGYTFDDRFPGHGFKDRTMVAAQRAELVKQDLLRQKIKDFLQHRRAEVQAAIHEPAQLINRVSSRLADLLNAQAMLKVQSQSVQRDFALVLGAYRDANTAVRATDPPKYFKEIPVLMHRVNDEGAAPLVQSLNRMQEELKAQREQQKEPLNNRLHQLQGDAAEIMSKTFTQFLAEVELEAKGRIDRLVHAIHRAA
jgi:multidrug efflux pump subunit AcrA (membrane-fusion protein)